MPNLILNRIKTPDGTILTSYHNHDYKTHIDKSGKTYMIDGGTQYLKRGGFEDYKEMSLYDTEPFDVIRENLHWGVNMTKDGKWLPKTKWTPICDLETDHLKTLLSGNHGSELIREFFEKELVEYRNANA